MGNPSLVKDKLVLVQVSRVLISRALIRLRPLIRLGTCTSFLFFSCSLEPLEESDRWTYKAGDLVR